jgi:hypothetical protein
MDFFFHFAQISKGAISILNCVMEYLGSAIPERIECRVLIKQNGAVSHIRLSNTNLDEHRAVA